MPKPYLEFDFQNEFKKSNEVKMYYVPVYKVMLVKNLSKHLIKQKFQILKMYMI